VWGACDSGVTFYTQWSLLNLAFVFSLLLVVCVSAFDVERLWLLMMCCGLCDKMRVLYIANLIFRQCYMAGFDRFFPRPGVQLRVGGGAAVCPATGVRPWSGLGSVSASLRTLRIGCSRLHFFSFLHRMRAWPFSQVRGRRARFGFFLRRGCLICRRAVFCYVGNYIFGVMVVFCHAG